ncbi:hypothetical protein [Paraburkholderia hayleyella]|nr:hypothetical protein [Paraburkholderia hayleyella]
MPDIGRDFFCDMFKTDWLIPLNALCLMREAEFVDYGSDMK